MTRHQSAEQSINAVREKTDSVVLFCSLGKDSLVLLDLIAPKFKRVVCVFMYFVKGLEHVERYIRWVKATYPNVEMVQIPHWTLTYAFRAGLYCTPRPNIKLLKLADVVKAIRVRYGLEYCFLGMKKADSMNRRLMLNGYEANNYENKGLVFPLAEWTQKEVLAYMKQHQLPEPVRYSKKASSGVGFDVDCFRWMEKNYPEDLEKIYKVFPLSERILYEDRLKREQGLIKTE